MKKESFEFLLSLLKTPSPSGYETACQKVWIDYVKRYAHQVKVDAYGNAIASLNLEGKPKILVNGHIDEIAFQIQYIDDSGFLYFSPIGGPDPKLARGRKVNIFHEGKSVPGVIGTLAIHMQEKEEQGKTPKWNELFIDIGASTKQEALEHVQVGDLALYESEVFCLLNDIWVSRGCDDKVGAFTAAEVLRICSEENISGPCIIAASTIQEENGLYGASMIGYSVYPDIAFVFDVGHATDIPIAEKKKFGDIHLGKGPILSHGSVNHPGLVSYLNKIAHKLSINHQHGIDPRRSGTDADALFIQRGGIPTCSIGIPNRYMHSPVEAFHLRDLETAALWIASFCKEIKSKEEILGL
ncbi:M20/M25/M40 family metallo-hydrolase [Methylacidiphilum caldifontis]|uniref:M20/M25/M40 family metallo-hydrolase n=1 Tax=Methylacidiphilum caldifontis TaxID=2795386 RepID=UPI001A90104A|nr:M20/M25/M40 family metallo-hydrolase [Methylacidiphilum caldifontis]QSR88381.1 M20/M25/M40 family metallo-hydrolase [Methylacidiphilum caldifontis]